MQSRIFRYLSSWWMTSGILLFLAASYVACLFGESPYADWTMFIFHTPSGVLLYCSLIANILLATVRIIIRRIAVPQISLKAIQAMDIYSVLPEEKLTDVAGLLKRKGYTVTVTGSSIHAVKHRYSFLPGTVSRVGIIIFLIAILASSQLRRSSETIIHQGQAMQAFGRQAVLKSISPDIPDQFLQIGEEGTFRLGSVKAELHSPAFTRTVTTGFPVRMDGLYYRITHVGIAQPITFRHSGMEDYILLDLDILPPGKTDLIALPFEDLFLSVSLLPERTISKGLVKGKEYNLRNPFYQIVIQKGKEKEKIGELKIREEESETITGISVSLNSHAVYLKVQAVSDPSLPFIYAGSFLVLLGILLMFSRFFWYSKELSAVCENSTLHLGYQEEFFKKWASQKFHSWIREYTGGEKE